MATDNFNRADGALGANWTGSVGGDLTIVDNQVRGVGYTDNSMYYSASTPDADQYVQVVIISPATYLGPLCRVSATDWVILDAAESEDKWKIEWYDGGDWTQIGADYSTSPAANDIAKITADGTTFKGYVNGTERISGTNADAPATGNGGLYAMSASDYLDDFEVGDLAPPAATANPWYAYAQQ